MRPFDRSFRRTTFAALLAAVAASGCRKEPPPRPKPAVPVTIAQAISGSLPITFATNGTVEPTQTVAIQPQVAGPITEVRFQEGDEVRAGQVLFVIDPRPYQAALAQAQAVLARDRATATATRADSARYASLVSKGFVTQSQAGQFAANATAAGATIASDQAQVDAARLNLSYATIRAPISGKTGNLNVRLGNQVRVPNTVPLVTINAVAPVLVRFPVPDRVLPQVRAAQREKRQLDVTIAGAVVNGAVERGTVDFIDNAVDTTTGSVTLKARFPNTDRRLWPGAFLPLTLGLGQTPTGVLVPTVAVQAGPQGDYVFMPDSAGKTRQVSVVTAQSAGSVTLVTKGVAVGERVVVDGQSRLTPGAVMKIARTVATQPPGSAPTPNAVPGSAGQGPSGQPTGAAPERVAANGANGTGTSSSTGTP